jgi:mercuric ion transport protein
MARHTLATAGLAGAILSLVSAICCVLPLLFIILGLGGAWLAVFGTVAAAGYYILGVTALILVVALFTAIRGQARVRAYALIFVGTVLTLLAWLILANERAINDILIELT